MQTRDLVGLDRRRRSRRAGGRARAGAVRHPHSINVARINAAALAGTDGGLSAEEIVTVSRRYGNHLGVELGAAYTSSAVVPDGTTPPVVADAYSDYVASATPGCRAPHVWLATGLSTLDLVGTRFVLLAAPGGAAWRDAACGLVDCSLVGGPGLREAGAFARAYGLEDDGAVLVRPDGHVAWRRRSGPPRDGELRAVTERLLGRRRP